MNSIADIRQDYQLKTLNEADVAANPIIQFGKWWDEAMHSNIDEVNAMTLATATKQGMPSARIVLLKGFDENGFVFFTNYSSHKAQEIEENNHVALLFFWKELQRQVRIEGSIAKINTAASDEYFNSRPEGSKIGAWASPQSMAIPSRAFLEDKVKELENNSKEKQIPRPLHWGGYVVKPVLMEFWQGRSSRLHDRIQYRHIKNTWQIERLAP